jgi:malate dehydrogenase (oxaloacetate-decarboxylating)(NADP+)
MVAQDGRAPDRLRAGQPDPEILPDARREVAPMRSSPRAQRFPNQVNNVLCFPFIFRGALDVGATEINDAMQMPASRASRRWPAPPPAPRPPRPIKGEQLTFGPDYLIPKPFDPRLIGVVASAVAKARWKRAWPPARSRISTPTSAARRLGLQIRAAHAAGLRGGRHRRAPHRLCRGRGRARAARRQAMLEETTDKPILIGRPEVIEARCERLGLPIRPGAISSIVNPENDPRYRDYWGTYHGSWRGAA